MGNRSPPFVGPEMKVIHSCAVILIASLDGAEGQAAGRLQRLGIRRLARWLLSAGHGEVRLPEALLERLRLCRGRLLVLPQPGACDDEGMVQVHASRISIRDEDAEADHP